MYNEEGLHGLYAIVLLFKNEIFNNMNMPDTAKFVLVKIPKLPYGGYLIKNCLESLNPNLQI